VFAGLLTVGTSFALLPETETLAANPSAPEEAEAELPNGEVWRVDVVVADLYAQVTGLTGSAIEVWNRWARSLELPSLPEQASGVLSIGALSGPGPEPEGSAIASADRVSGGDAGFDPSDWERAWVIILTCIGIGTEASARCRGLSRRNPLRPRAAVRASLGPGPGSSWGSISRTIPRFPLTWLRGLLRPGSLVAPAKVPLGK
jgi:hypothetical protein